MGQAERDTAVNTLRDVLALYGETLPDAEARFRVGVVARATLAALGELPSFPRSVAVCSGEPKEARRRPAGRKRLVGLPRRGRIGLFLPPKLSPERCHGRAARPE
jgi:hypothetical protein